MIVRRFYLLVMLMLQAVAGAQGFQFDPASRSKAVIPFHHINNLVIVPVEVNGVMLNFLLDSGVDETILFSLDEQEVSFENLEKVSFTGLGSAEPIQGLRSGGNTLSFKGFKDTDHDIYIVLDQDLNFSGSIGIPVNGIIGHNFFRNFPVEINYITRKITVHRRSNAKWARRYEQLPMSIELGKPYVQTLVTMEQPIEAKMLIDVGNSDAVWLFADRSARIQVPEPNFADYLGRGFSGEVHGRRARISQLKIAGHAFLNPIAAFPDTSSTRSMQMVEERIGSIGGEILRRFSIILDYPARRMYLRPNANFTQPFQYNMSGLDIQHAGMTWVRETVDSAQPTNLYDVNGEKIPNTFTFKFQLKPMYSVSNVRESSPAWESGIRAGDLIKQINKRQGYRFSLQQINNLLKSEEGREMNFVIEREGKELNFNFKLKSVL